MTIAYKRSNTHYYDDGDVALICPSNYDDRDRNNGDNGGNGDGDVALVCLSTIFKVHSTVLRLASAYFNTRFSPTWSSESRRLLIEKDKNEDSELTSIAMDLKYCKHHAFIDNEEEDDIALLIAFIYPIEHIVITWDNVNDILRLADKYLINKALQTAADFLMSSYSEKPLTSLRLAETYNFPKIFKQSSTHIIDNVCAYKEHPEFGYLSDRTRRKLFQARLELSEGVTKSSFPTLSYICSSCYNRNADLDAFVQKLREPTSIFSVGLQNILKFGDNMTHTECMRQARSILGKFIASHYGTACLTLATLESVEGFSIELD
ncbi:hypothetical protein BC936DRAFT_148337 [Jimgerdemannia flammicorona]|uniref:BTB domain-containing protein n=1 Tax=Jimgerdemannia flammicorona TaxID=994334 RepID=A0A433DKP7_9FUNG|nr:hypothetical protein BC936DRAFT_148337 [Jimgerdemannia flammicorona]